MMTPKQPIAEEADRHIKLSPQTFLSLSLVIVLVGAAVTYGRQSERLDSIQLQVVEARAEVRAMTRELQSFRELLIQRTPTLPLPERK